MLGWIADVFRSGIALWYWNLRKTRFRLRGARGRALCQKPSDSGRAGITGCDACLHWHEPTRFGHVCPLLGVDAQGRRMCAVEAAAARPFWGRALAWQGGGALTLYLLITLLVFGVMRHVGYPVGWFDVAWPPAWSQLDTARAEFFYPQRQTAYREGRLSATVAHLVLARRYDPTHFGTGMLLAQIWQTARPDSADEIYRTLLAAHPDRAVPVAEVWFRSLLTRGNLPAFADLAARRPIGSVLSILQPLSLEITYAMLA